MHTASERITLQVCEAGGLGPKQHEMEAIPKVPAKHMLKHHRISWCNGFLAATDFVQVKRDINERPTLVMCEADDGSFSNLRGVFNHELDVCGVSLIMMLPGKHGRLCKVDLHMLRRPKTTSFLILP